jgi:hypothetical protein
MIEFLKHHLGFDSEFKKLLSVHIVKELGHIIANFHIYNLFY